jgi:hypothetical protein
MIYLAGFASLFQLPLLLITINKIKPLRTSTLLGYLRWVILVSFIVAAILTPTPDPFNQTVMALPIIILYLISVLLLAIINFDRKQSAGTLTPHLQATVLANHRLSGIQFVHKNGREGFLCQWEPSTPAAGSLVFTFYHQGNHEVLDLRRVKV